MIHLVVPLRTKVGSAIVVAAGAYLDEGVETGRLLIRERPGDDRRSVTVKAGDTLAISGKQWIVDSIKVTAPTGALDPIGVSEDEVVIRELTTAQ